MWYVINTTHLKHSKRRRHKSRLDIEVLACLAINGKLSKGNTETILKDHDHHVVLDAFKRLQNDGRIKISHSEHGRGRRKDFFRITEKGLIFLISEVVEPWKFWRAMMGYCWHANSQITIGKLKEFYKIFIDKYLRYPSEYGYCFDLDLFNKVCKDWLQNIIQNAEGITLDQVILETLAINPKLTLEQLVQKIRGSGIDQIKKTLFHYTPIPHKPATIGPANVDDIRTGKIHIRQRWELLLYYAIKVRQNPKGAETYELSLFGILLIMLILRNHDMGKLKHGLYHKDESFRTYYDKIAYNYQNNLPLIFGKWFLLKKILKILAAYNFDIVLDKEMRDNAIKSLSLISDIGKHDEPQLFSITGGNKELYETARSIEEISYSQLGHIQVKGMEESSNFVGRLVHNFPDMDIQKARSIIRKKTSAVFQLIDEITVLLDPLSYDPKSFIEDVGEEFLDAESLSRLYDIDTLEKSFANQISFRYFLNLNNEHPFKIMHPTNYYSTSMIESDDEDRSQENEEEERDEYSLRLGGLSLSPRLRLFSILRGDDDIKRWFSSWIANLENYQNNVLSKTRNLHQEIEELESVSSQVVSR